jgi:hypothetical protein
MNELTISIKNPYTNKEIYPSMDNESLYDKKICNKAYSLMDIYVVEDNGVVKFAYTPCLCYISNKFEPYICSNFSDIIHCDKFNQFKKDVLDNNYSTCMEHGCHVYNTFKNGNQNIFYNWKYFIEDYDYYAKQIYYKDYIEVPDTYTVSLHISHVCNLKCKTCRDEYQNDFDLTEHYDDIINGLKQVHELNIGCDGETFMSKVYRYILSVDLTENSKLEKINVFTNGTLMNETALSNIHPNNFKLIKQFRISIDAVNEETYKNLRINGVWNTLLNNIKLLNENYKSKYGFKLCTVYTISRYNLSDVYDFYDFAKELGFEDISYTLAKPQFYGNRKDFVLTENEIKDIKQYLENNGKNNSGSFHYMF